MLLTTKTTPQPRRGERLGRRKERTRSKILASAFEIMSRDGVDAAKIRDITENADIGFGTFYNYFESKDDLASAVLDCLIEDMGRRNVLATSAYADEDACLVFSISTRLVIRQAMHDPMWQWWAAKPDLLVARFCKGFGPFAKRDIQRGIHAGRFKVDLAHLDGIWSLASWIAVGGMHDIAVSSSKKLDDALIVKSIIMMVGIDEGEASVISKMDLPEYPSPKINWKFII